MKIPDKVRVGAHDYKVLYPYYFVEADRMGEVLLNLKQIMIRDVDLSGRKLPKSST